MSKVIDEAAVRHVASLARLRLSDAEVALFTKELEDVLDYVAQLNEVDTSNVPPTAHPLQITNVFRDDEAGVSWTSESATANAPQQHEGFFKVPRVLTQNSV